MIRFSILALFLAAPLAAQEIGPMNCRPGNADTLQICIQNLDTLVIIDTLPPHQDTLPVFQDTLPPFQDTLPPFQDTLATADTVEVFPEGALERIMAETVDRTFEIFQTGYYKFFFDGRPVADLEARADGVRGTGRWVSGDRIAYHTAYAFFSHQDPGNHGDLIAFRFFVQIYSDQPDGTLERVNDRFMPEPANGGVPPYPYEPEQIIPVDLTRPATLIKFYHQRPADEGRRQLLFEYVLPEDLAVTWFYQLGGTFVGVHDTLGEVVRVIISAQHPRYFFNVCVDVTNC